MSQIEQLEGMTVVELRKFAKDQGITLSSLTTKSSIVGRIHSEMQARTAQVPIIPVKPAEAPRKAMIIADDGEDAHQPLTPPRSKPMVDKTKTSTGKTKPVFTLQGSRAWHNPQPFAQTQPPAPKFTSPAHSITTLGRDSEAEARGAMIRPSTNIPRVSRFGPDAGSIPEPSLDIMQKAQEAQFSRPAPSQATRPNPYQSGAFHSVLRQPGVEHGYSAPEEAQSPNTASREGRINPAVPELLATGECGDGAGILEIQPDGYGFLRAGNLLAGRNDVYISGTQIRRFRLRNGDYVVGKTRPQRENDRYAAMLYITSINGEDADDAVKLGGEVAQVKPRVEFDSLTPVYPNRRIRLSSKEENDLVLRLIDLFVPIGFGQRAMIVAPPKAGKTTILKKIALSLKRNHPDVHTMMLLVDERPEEVTDLKETVGGDIFYSTFDEPAENHARVSELTLARAMRFVETGKDVVILLDSLTRLSRAYNTLMPSSARVMSGGLAAGALNKPKRFFGAARNLKEEGSLTIIATALVDTGSRMDGVIFEEFKGTGNMELTLDRQLSERRLFPAVSLLKSGTRHEELLLSREEMEAASHAREMLSSTGEQEALPLLLSMLEKSRDNDEFVARFDDWVKLMRNR